MDKWKLHKWYKLHVALAANTEVWAQLAAPHDALLPAERPARLSAGTGAAVARAQLPPRASAGATRLAGRLLRLDAVPFALCPARFFFGEAVFQKQLENM